MRLPGHALREWALLTGALLLLTGIASWQGWLWRADQMLYDIGVASSTRPAPADIVIVAIDEESLRRIGRWPWSRTIHATLINKLTAAQAHVIGLDLILSEADTTVSSGDALLANEIRKNGRVVLPVVPRTLLPGLISDGRPIPLFRTSAAALGHIEIQLDPDGIARGIYLWGGLSAPLHPQFALALQKVSRGDTAFASEQRRQDAESDHPMQGWQRDAWIHPQFAGPPGTFTTVSYVDVLTGRISPEALRDKFVLIGATATGLGDQYPTPMSALGIPMSGIEIHANVLDALRGGHLIDGVSVPVQTMITVALLILLLAGLLLLSPRNGLVLSACFVLTILVGSLGLLRFWHLWLPPSAALLGTVLAYPLWSWRRLETAQSFIHSELQTLQESEPGLTRHDPPASPIDPLETNIAIIRAATAGQRAARKVRDDTIRFISHDIRSPLAAIITLVEGAGPHTDKRLQRAGHYAQSALDLADDFFRLAKAEALDARSFVDLDVTALIQDAVDAVWPFAEQRQISVRHHDDTGEYWTRGDRAQLARALTNLLHNAIKFSPTGTTVSVSVDCIGSWLEVAILDQGCGISPQDMGRLFTPYGRVGPQEPAGIGLGLVIVKTIVTRHGGDISVDSLPGQGSRFRIRLPHTATPPA